jgi:hypothetical protein
MVLIDVTILFLRVQLPKGLQIPFFSSSPQTTEGITPDALKSRSR